MAAPSSSKRHSILPPAQAGPKPPVQFSSSITIADSAILIGTHPITISTESVIHPRAQLNSLGGRITIGRRCIVHERSTVGAVGTEGGRGAGGTAEQSGVTLGDYVTVEVGASIETGDTVVGEGTNIGVGSKIGGGAVVGKHCTLTPYTVVAAGDVIPDYTVIYSNGLRRQDRRGVAELRNKGQARQIEVLKRMIPSSPAKFQ
ncbi:trimeric LpxA-like protein [Podospora appendiculata]|uniref:Dynactin subunit 6 n=1 Tax=Podospora appendiculata TaxID=314037 RepID=A0AAE0XF63_9PEZI|nr:trimeric LpxA-like protein [Podospora appendiculata]